MRNAVRTHSASFLLIAFAIACAGSASAADIGWRVSKSSGDVWVSTSGVQQASLTQEAVLNAGDTIRTGRNGRVLLVRGQEKILISPNSVIGLPAQKSPGQTTITQQSGTILIEAEKRNNPHFEVETPYLAAVVKGTQFRVSVSQSESYVNVLKGQVDVTGFRSGQTALITPGQIAKVWAIGNGGLQVSGSGQLNPIRPGTPRTPSLAPIQASADGLSVPDSATTGQRVVAMAPRGDAASFPSFEGSARGDGLWNAGRDYVGSLFGKTDGAQVRSGDAAMIAIPIGFGAVIAFVVAAKRRRQKHNQK